MINDDKYCSVKMVFIKHISPTESLFPAKLVCDKLLAQEQAANFLKERELMVTSVAISRSYVFIDINLNVC